jgi:pimeloyl-ACP methyl ester carboxylesterase
MSNATRYREAEARLFAHAGIRPTEHRVALPTLGVEARVLEVGAGTPALFLHGGPAAGAIWAELVGRLEGVRCLLLDRPGTGLSDAPPYVPSAATLRGYVEQLTVDVLDAFGIRRAALVGSSFGGYSALCSAARHPDRVDRVVLAGCPPFVPGWAQPSFFALLRTPLVGSLLRAAPATRASARLSLKQLGHRAGLAADRISEPMLAWTRAWQRDTSTMRNDAAMIRACGVRGRRFDPALDLTQGDLREVRAPCLLLAGTDDPVGDEGVMRSLAEVLPDATVEVWDRVGHLPWLDDPARAAAVTGAFLSGGRPT